jgi:mono/diheme cytochrome c family protein
MRRGAQTPRRFAVAAEVMEESVVVESFLRVGARLIVITALAGTPFFAAGAEGELVNPYAGQEDIIEEGGSLLNQYCSHCHGPWAVQGERPRDLRRLNLRYGDYAMSTFYTTVQNGRPPKGMPPWKGILEDDIIWKIYTFLQSVQVED